MQSNKTKALDVVEVEGKGLGVVAGENIDKHSFVCEYKYNLTYPRNQRDKWEEEYKINGEECYIIDAQLPTGKWVCFDATRNFHSFGRYINHARAREANLKLHPPLLIRGKRRVGLYATKPIPMGEELAYDYGDQPNKLDFMKLHKVTYS